MQTSVAATQQLELALEATKSATDIIENLVAEHLYQDVASLVTQAASALIEAANALMRLDDSSAIEFLDKADDLLDDIFYIIDAETDDE